MPGKGGTALVRATALASLVGFLSVGVTALPNMPSTLTCPNMTILDVGIANAETALGNVSTPNAAACCAACMATPRCTAWTWHPESGFEPLVCWLMPVPAAPHGAPKSVVSGVPPPPPPPPPSPPLPPLPPPQKSPALGYLPNIVFVLTDDQDITQDSMMAMPKTRALYGLDVGGKGCVGLGRCFSMARTYVTQGCASDFWVRSIEPRAYPAYLAAAGYRTAFFGKYLNAYGTNPSSPMSHVPPGWHKWVGLRGNSAYYGYELSIDGTPETHGSDYATDYLTDVLKNRSVAWLNEELSAAGGPVLTVVHTPSPHRPAIPAPQYMNSFTNLTAPRTPSWNHISGDKHKWLSTLVPMDDNLTQYSDHLWRRRLRSLQSVDDLVAAQFEAVEAANALDKTVFVYTSDHGYHSGQWGVAYCKMLPYEEDVRIPMYIRIPGNGGPGSGAAANIVSSPVLNIDLAPSFLDIAGYSDPEMDGQSFIPLFGQPNEKSVAKNRTFLIEYWPLVTKDEDVQVTRSGVDGWCTDPDVLRKDCPILPVVVDSVNNTWACLHTVSASADTVFCLFWDGTGWDMTFPRDPALANFVEYYDLSSDAWQLSNAINGTDPASREAYVSQLEQLMHCNGTANCNPFPTHYQ